jgi:hypothetical protein
MISIAQLLGKDPSGVRMYEGNAMLTRQVVEAQGTARCLRHVGISWCLGSGDSTACRNGRLKDVDGFCLVDHGLQEGQHSRTLVGGQLRPSG